MQHTRLFLNSRMGFKTFTAPITVSSNFSFLEWRTYKTSMIEIQGAQDLYALYLLDDHFLSLSDCKFDHSRFGLNVSTRFNDLWAKRLDFDNIQ